MSPKTYFNLIGVAGCLATAVGAQAQDTAFTYQGVLRENGAAPTGAYQVRFTLHDAGNGGSVVAGPITNTAVAVLNGLFTTTLDFGGAVFDGNRRWLEIGVATNGADGFTTLDPRQEILATPYAIAAARLTGPLPSNGLAGTYAQPVSLSNPANTFAGDGGGLTNVQALTLGGLSRADLWQLGGNAGTASNSFLGTTDNQPLELRVNDVTLLRLQTGEFGAVNMVGGYGSAVADGYISGAIIGGGISNRVLGGNPTVAATVSGGYGNEVAGHEFYVTIAGGKANHMYGVQSGSTISGGEENTVEGDSWGCGIGGGIGNLISGTGSYCAISGGKENTISSGRGIWGANIGGGEENKITGAVFWSTISGGRRNSILDNDGRAATIGGGEGNSVVSVGREVIGGGLTNVIERSLASVIGGGSTNRISLGRTSDSWVGNATISGGANNAIWTNSFYSTVGGGSANVISNSPHATISGGLGNSIPSADFGTIAGGESNLVSASCSTIPGGHHNEIGADSRYSAIGGGQNNNIAENSEWSTISGGSDNSIGGVDSYGSTIGGGQLNNIAGHSLLSTIAGGYANIVGANSDGSVIAGGRHNEIASGSSRSFIAGGRGNGIGGNSPDSTIAGGSGNTIATNSEYGTIAGGANNLVNARSSTVPGGRSARTSNYGQMAYASGSFAAAGDAQTSVYVCRGTTSDASSTELFLDGASQRMAMPTNSTWAFDILVTGRAPDGTTAAYQILGAARNNAGITTLAAAPRQTILVEDVPTWNAVPFATAADNALSIQVTGAAATSIRWVATIRTTEVTY